MKTVRAHEVNTQAEVKFGTKFKKLEATVKDLAARLRALENSMNTIPIQPAAKAIEPGSVLDKDK